MSHTPAVARGCGRRAEGGIYAECGMSPFGQPLEHFLCDPPLVIDPLELGVAPIGVTLIDDPNGVTHVFDWIGSKHYHNVADFLEEARRYGPSRRLPTTLEFERLSPESRMVLIHSRGFIENHDALHDALRDQHAKHDEGEGPTAERGGDLIFSCITGKREHWLVEGEANPSQMCAGLWWNDVEPVGQMERLQRESRAAAGFLQYVRHMPSFTYDTAHLPPDGFTPKYQPAIIASFPITNLAVIRGQHGEHERALSAVERAGIDHSLDDA